MGDMEVPWSPRVFWKWSSLFQPQTISGALIIILVILRLRYSMGLCKTGIKYGIEKSCKLEYVTDRSEGCIIKCKEESVTRMYFTNERPNGRMPTQSLELQGL